MIRAALVTGANSGIGFETAKALARAGASQVFLACRNGPTAENARSALEQETGCKVFRALPLDLGNHDSVRRAASVLIDSGVSLDLLVFNAGVLPGKQRVLSEDGFEITSAASLVGHHVLLSRLLRGQGLSSKARIIIAGSEGARGDAPGMKPLDLKDAAKRTFAGNLQGTISAVLKMSPPLRHHWSTTYCTAKVLVALWARAVAKELPRGVTVNAVSPGNAPGTRAVRNQPLPFRAVMRMLACVGPTLGIAMPASVAAQRYLAVADMADDVTGHFFASPPKRLVGRLERQNVPHLLDDEAAICTLRALVHLTGEALSGSGAGTSTASA